MKPQKYQIRWLQRDSCQDMLNYQKLKTNRESSSSKRKAMCYTQENFRNTISGFLSRNLASQKGVGWYIQRAERKKKIQQQQKTANQKSLYLTKPTFSAEGELRDLPEKQSWRISLQSHQLYYKDYWKEFKVKLKDSN